MQMLLNHSCATRQKCDCDTQRERKTRASNMWSDSTPEYSSLSCL